jgi:hypothetical protein
MQPNRRRLEMKNNGTELTCKWMLVTPEMALLWLDKNTLNRTLRQSHVNEFIDIIRTGKWVPTTDAIGIDTNGHLTNGQHRLWACAESGIPILLLVANGLVHESTFPATDTHQRRTISDQTGMNPLINGAIAGALTLDNTKIGGKRINAGRVRDIQIEFYEMYNEQCDLIPNWFATSRRFVTNNQVKGVVLRGLISTGETAKIGTFVSALYNPADFGSFVMGRNAMRLIQSLSVGGGGTNAYHKTACVLRASLANKELQKLYSSNHELFPIKLPSGCEGDIS